MAHGAQDSHHERPSAEQVARRASARAGLIADGAARRRPLKQRLILDGVLAAVVVAITALVVPFADIANPTYAEGRSIANRLDTAYAGVWRDGSAATLVATDAGLHLEQYSTDGGTVSVMTVPEPSDTSGFCYGLRFGGGGPTDAVRFRATEGCVPLGRSAFETVGTWSDVLGTERVTSAWFVPALVVLVGALIAVLTDASIVVVTERGRRP